MEQVSPCSLIPNIWIRNSLVSVIAAAWPPPRRAPPPPSLLLPADATDPESSSPPLFSDADECVFVSGIQSYTLKSISRKDTSDTSAGAAGAAAVEFLIILNFFISLTSVVGIVSAWNIFFSLFQFYRYKQIKLNDIFVIHTVVVIVRSNACGIHNSPKPIICMGCLYAV
jgi:hypothetical protein